jgi:glycosyltransferase involved in cell wall biosynthesis
VTAPSSAPSIAFISSHARVGGSEAYLLQLIEQLGGRIRPSLVLLEDGPLVMAARRQGLEPILVPTGARAHIAVGSWRVRKELARLRPDVVHANGVKAALVAWLASPQHVRPVVWAKHDHSWDGRLARHLAARSDVVVAVSESAGAAIEGIGRVLVVPPGISVMAPDVSASRRRLRELAGCGPDDAVLLGVGRLDVAKGYDTAIDVLVGVRRRLSGARLFIVGDVEPQARGLRDELQERALVAGVGDAVTFVGARPDAHALIAGADGLLVTSRSVDRRGMGREGFGLVALEALALGTPVVGFRDGATPEVVGDCGLLVAPGDTAALTAAAISVLTDESKRSTMVTCGRARAGEFDPARWADRMLDVYRSLLPNGSE